MATRILKVALCLVLLVWLSWPIVECFDTWDKPVDTGNDSQYTFVVLGICAGAVYMFSKRRQELLLIAVAQVTRTIGKLLREYRFVAPFVSFLSWTPDAPSPPLTPASSVTILRI
jgi:hypothetical protein